MTVHAAVAESARLLTENGFESEDARRDVAVIARHLLGWSLTDWATRKDETATGEFVAHLSRAARRRATREPVAYITGVREFYGREFQVTPATLIPRPETEALIDRALQAMHDLHALHPPHAPEGAVLVDVGTGSGCIAVTLALEIPDARIVATDTSPAALAVARANAARLRVAPEQIEFVETSLIPANLQADVIVSNPPYVPERDRASMSADVRDFEPGSALFAGDDGLDVIRKLVPAAAAALKPAGWLVMEIGAGQAHEVRAVIDHAGLKLQAIEPDLQNIPRVLIARK